MAARRVDLAAVVALALGGPVLADECRLALALGLDVSGSVDAREYRLQLEGVATALSAPAVRRAMFGQPSAYVQIMVYEWSGAGDHHILAEWSALRTPSDVTILQETLLQTRRRYTSPGTAIGDAMQVGLAQLQARPDCWKRVLDISGDGKSNLGPHPRAVRAAFEAANVTLNALVIGADAPNIGDLRQAEIAELSSYFRTNVITGEDAFVQTALGYDHYAEAMARKLERELESFAISALPRQR